MRTSHCVIFLLIFAISCKNENPSAIVQKESNVAVTASSEGLSEFEPLISGDSLDNAKDSITSDQVELVEEEVKTPIVKPPKKKKPITSKRQDAESTNVINSKKEVIKKPEPKEELTEIIFRRNFFAFGDIVQGDTINFEYSFTNMGDQALIIKDATATCGCAKPNYPFTAIAPGESGEITGIYVSDTKKGPQNAMIKVVANTDPPIHKLILEGNVLLEAEVKKDTDPDETSEDTKDEKVEKEEKGEKLDKG